jgi:hypothetical protein
MTQHLGVEEKLYGVQAPDLGQPVEETAGIT